MLKSMLTLVLSAFFVVSSFAQGQRPATPPGQQVSPSVQDDTTPRGRERGEDIRGAAREQEFEQLQPASGYCAIPTDISTCDCPEGLSPIANLDPDGTATYECGLG